MLLSVHQCHQKNIIHRDVKLENFLIDCQEDGYIQVKLTDFGLASKLEQGKKLTNKCGSLVSIAPEMLTGKPYTHKVDMWGLGVALYELFASVPPFYSDVVDDHKDNIVHQHISFDDNQVWKRVSSEAKDILLKLLSKDPRQRPSAEQALNHPWFICKVNDKTNISKNYASIKSIDKQTDDFSKQHGN